MCGGAHVPFRTLLDRAEAGDPVGEFLQRFPSVGREQAVAALNAARDRVSARLPAT